MGGCCLQDERMWRCLSSLTSLRELHTENLKLADVPGEVSLLTRLTSLHHRDGLERLSTDLSPLQNLVELDISGSSLGGFPALPCQSLETLKMNRCHLGTLLNQEGLSKLKASAAFEESDTARHGPNPPIWSGDSAHGSRIAAGGF